MRLQCVDVLDPAVNANAGKVERTNAHTHTHTPTSVLAHTDKSAPCRYAALRRFCPCRYGALTRILQCIVTTFVDRVRAPTGHLHVFLRAR